MATSLQSHTIPEVVMPTCTVQQVLRGQKALVTGANSGIGLGVAMALGQAGKGGVMLMMKSIAQEVAPYRIRVNSIAPGAIRTPINTSAWDTPAAYNALMTLVPYKRIGEAEDIGHAAVWLASDAADYVTGISLYIDGGMTLYPGFATGG